MLDDKPSGDYIMKLSKVSRQNIELVGVKAANLGELSRAGFPVPDGFVLTSTAFKHFLAKNSFYNGSSPETVMNGIIPDDVVEALNIAIDNLGSTPMVVRSSGVTEDLPGASFAGQYVTVLDVYGLVALVDAIRRCWASAFEKRVMAYRASRGEKGISALALLIQQLVNADAAGVAFTANPVTGDRTETVVSAVSGLGERLVSGQASPDEWLVKKNETVCKRAPEGAIDKDNAESIAELARKAEAYFGSPQDIEWAVAGNKLFLLQACPITSGEGSTASSDRAAARFLATRDQPLPSASIANVPDLAERI